MNKRIISTALSCAMAVSVFSGFTVTASAEAKAPQYQEKARQMEQLNRGLIAVKTTADPKSGTSDGVYLSWRLFGTESLEKQAFDIYRDGEWIHTVEGGEATCWTDPSGTAENEYVVVKERENISKGTPVKPTTNFNYATDSNSLGNAFTYMDVPIERPEPNNGGNYYTTSSSVQGGANDASVGDLDGDGDYEIVLKWDPTNSKDAAGGGATGRTYIDAYEISEDNTNSDGNGHLYKWRIDLGPHVRSGAHENPFLVYDFDGDGKAEVVAITGLGATDGKGEYVTKAGDTDEIRNADNSKTYLRKGKNIGPEYYTIFDGETGEAVWTTDAIPIGPTKNEDGSFSPEDGSYFGDAKMNRSSRYLAAVAYLDGVHPSIVMCRGYYARAMLRAYTWDGNEMAMQWEHNGGTKGTTLYGQGNHNLSVGDIDGDGKDEIVYGSASLDDDGKTVLGNTKLGHGDAMHMSDFNNDGVQEVFSVKEDGEGFKYYAEDLRVASTGEHFWAEKKIVTSDDNGRGVMDNIDDEYAKTHPNALALGWSSGKDKAHDLNGDDVNTKPASAGNGSFDNSLIYWDGDLSRELLDTNIIQKYDAANGWTKRFYGPSDGYTLTGGTTNNYSKRNASLSADLWGDWREEVILPTGKGQDETPALRIYTSVIPTEYRLTTLMHDCQYRLGIVWQNVAYNQPPHTSYYIGSAALATDDSGNTLNYLAPAVSYTNVTYDAPAQVAVTGIEIENKEVTVEKGKSASIGASVIPDDATKKGITYTSSDEKVAKVSNGIVTGVGVGTATITATTKDGGFTDTCTVTVFENPVTGVSVSERVVELGIGNTAKLSAEVMPSDASDKSVVWASEDTSVAEVDEEGGITGIGLGKTAVTATSGGKTAKCIVKVKPMNIVDATGEDVFVSGNTDAETTPALTAVSAKLDQNMANVGAEAHKDFAVYSDNTAKLSFRLTTGGIKGVTGDGNWNWTGHEYTMGLKFLDADGNNIVNVYQPYAAKATDLMSIIGDSTAQKVTDTSKSGWSNSGNVSGNIQGSAKRWVVEAEFDYNNDTCTITINGAGKDGNEVNSWEPQFFDGTMTQTFPLNGAKFKTLSLYTQKDGSGGIKAAPDLTNVSYTSTEHISGNTDVLYEKGTDNAEWAETDLEDWTQTGTETAALEFDTDNRRIWYNPKKPTAEYSAEKTFDIDNGAVVSYDVDWYFGSAVARDGNYEYLQIGDKLRLGWTNGYKLMLSTDGGTTYGETAIFTGEKATTYTKNVKAQFNTNLKTVTLSLDGAQIYSGAYSDADDNTADGANSVKFGFTRAGEAPDWEVPNGIGKIRVAQFIKGEEEPDFSAVKITGTDGNKVNIAYDLVDYDGGSVQFIGALYDASGKLIELKANEVTELDTSVQHIRQGTDSVAFTNDIADGTIKVFMWDSLDHRMPIGDCASK